jgi:16S rRNA (adenine1518-N6/adenine1519-N6)-dimethyltransferase
VCAQADTGLNGMDSTSGHRARKRFGQNFLVDRNIIQNIVQSIHPAENDLMIEIGPGLGAMTIPLLEHLEQLHVIEFDRDVIPKLQHNCEQHMPGLSQRLVVHEADVLKFDFSEFYMDAPGVTGSDIQLRIVGNLPYNISTPILFHLLGFRDIISDMHFMLQKEVVDRITAKPGNKLYGRLSVMLQTFCDTQALFNVPATAFRPQPKVESAIIRLIPNARYKHDITRFDAYEKLVRMAFAQRRKTIRNTLRSLCSAEQISAAGFDPSARAETLSIKDFVALYQSLHSGQ